MTVKIRELDLRGQKALAEGGVNDAAFDSRALLSFAVGVPFSRLPLHYSDTASEKEQEVFLGLIERRIAGEPLQYITGEQEFMGLSFYVDERVLIPRLDTEILVEEALKYIKEATTNIEEATSRIEEETDSDKKTDHREFRVLDLCSGSGAIGLSVAKLSRTSQIGDDEAVTTHPGDNAAAPMLTDDAAASTLSGEETADDVGEAKIGHEDGKGIVKVTLTDISDDALSVTRKNAEALGVAEEVSIVQGDLFDGVKESGLFDMIISNPPYIPSEVIETLDTEVKDHEPRLALDGGEDGLDIYRRIITEAPDHLKKGGVLMMEIGAEQADMIRELAEKSGRYVDFDIKKDLAGLDRVVITKVQ